LAKRDPSPGATTVLPTGRLVTPRGRQVVVAPHPYGMALSPDGATLAVTSNGVGPFALTLIGTGENGAVRTLTDAEEPDFKSAYKGVAFSPDGRTVYVSGGDDGRVHVFDSGTGKRTAAYTLDVDGAKGSLPGDLAVSPDRKTLYVADQGNWRLVVLDAATGKVTGATPTGRIPFAVTLSPDGKRVYVANIGLFEYTRVAGTADKRGLPFPPFGYPSKAAREGVTLEGGAKAAGLGWPGVPEAYSVWAFDVSAGAPKGLFRQSTGIPVGYGAGEEEDGDEDEPKAIKGAVGGSAPCALAASATGRVYVANANNDTVDVLDGATGARVASIPLLDLLPDKRLRALRGMSPYGMAVSPDGARLYVSLAGFNAVAVVDAKANRPLGLIPAAWYAARVAVSPDGKRLYVASAKGFGSGPNGGKNFTPGPEGTGIGRLMKGAVSLMDVPADAELPALTRTVLTNNGALSAPDRPKGLPPVKCVVFITKENRTYDEVFGALPGGRGDASLARLGTERPVKGIGTDDPVVPMPNHVALARRYAVSDNFYMDSDHSADGHRWLAAAPPNHWAESVVSAGYGGRMHDDTDSPAPGRRLLFGSNSSATPEDYPEAGTLWHHLARHNVPFSNWGEGFEFAGIDEGAGLKPTGARLPLNIPMPLPLYKNTSRRYPGYNTNIPDQYRADVFLEEFAARFESGKEPLPGLIYIHLPNDHSAGPRPKDGYPAGESYYADNDLALGRILERLSRSKFWRQMAVFVTEDDAQGGVDSVDAHRSVLMVLSPWAKKGYVSRRITDISAIHHGIFALLGLPPLSLYDALAGDLSDFWIAPGDKPDLTPYTLVPVDKRLFDPAKAKDPLDPDYKEARRRGANTPLDDPDEVERLRRAQGLDD
jgi:YVTN family beta-propeller protein